MNIELLIAGRKVWQNSFEKKLNPVKELEQYRKAIGYYEAFLKSLPARLVCDIIDALECYETGK